MCLISSLVTSHKHDISYFLLYMPINLDLIHRQDPHYGIWLVVFTTFLFWLIRQDMAIVFSVFIVILFAWHRNCNLCNLYHLQTKLREWQRERMFNDKVLRKTFGLMMDEVTGYWSYLHTEEHEIQTEKNGGGGRGGKKTQKVCIQKIKETG